MSINFSIENINKCQICGQINPTNGHFFKEHGVSAANYHYKFFPKSCLFSGEKIIFKDLDSYFLTDFEDKNKMREWLKNQNKEKQKIYLIDLLKRRKELKNQIYALSHFESRAVMMPPVSYFEKSFDEGYNWFCQQVELKTRFDYKIKLSFNKKQLEMICDTREQDILGFNNKIIQKLDYGDYTVKNSNIFIERKSLADGIGSLSQGFDRLRREIGRARKGNAYIVFLIEEKYSNLNSFNYLPHMKNTKAKPEFIHHQIRDLSAEFPENIQFLAVDGRREAIKVIEKIFQLNEDIRNIDLQFCYENNKLIFHS